MNMPSKIAISPTLTVFVVLAAGGLGIFGLISPDPMLFHAFWPLMLLAATAVRKHAIIGAGAVFGGLFAVVLGLSGDPGTVPELIYGVPVLICLTAGAVYASPRRVRKDKLRTAMLERMVQSAPRTLLAFADENGICRFANDGFRRYWGRYPGDIVGQSLENLLGVENHLVAADDIQRALAGELRQVALKGGDDGPFKWFVLSLKPSFDHEAKFQGLIILINDVTAYYEAERDQTELILTLERRVEERTMLLQQKLSESEADNRARLDFLTRISDELRCSLNSLLGFSEVFSRQVYGSLGDPRYIDHSRQIRDRAVSLLSFAAQLQEISGIEGGSPEMTLSHIDLRDVCEAVAPLAIFMAERKNVALSFPSPAISAGVVGNFEATKRILTNLVDNAIKYTPEGGHVRVSFTSSNEFLDLTVEDDGSGMTPEDMDRAMGQLDGQSTGNCPYADKSAGLGLSIVKTFADRQETPFRLEARPQNGLRAMVRFVRADHSGGLESQGNAKVSRA